LIGRWFYENVNNGIVKNVEHIGKAEGGVEKSYAVRGGLEKIFR